MRRAGLSVTTHYTRSVSKTTQPLPWAIVDPVTHEFTDATREWAYTAAAWDDRRGCQVAWALNTDRRRHWDPATHSTPELSGRIEARLAADDNPLLRQLAKACPAATSK